MFTGIIEALGEVVNSERDGANVHLHVRCPFTQELKIDESVAHDGACLTVVSINGDTYQVTAIDETLQKTNLNRLDVGSKVNLERAMRMNARLDGHIVQGHVDQVGECLSIEEVDGSWVYQFRYKPSRDNLVIEKGSICINGISLTAYACTDDTFKVSIIPHTYQLTNISEVQVGTKVNLEFDIIGKYVAKISSIK